MGSKVNTYCVVQVLYKVTRYLFGTTIDILKKNISSKHELKPLPQ